MLLYSENEEKKINSEHPLKLWQKKTQLHSDIETYTVGEDPQLDMRLLPYDCLASKAHAKMLEKMGILTEDETRLLIRGLDNITRLYSEDQFTISQSQEDCHTAIENYLTQQYGELGKKIHTARSRNDQVIAALRLYYKDQIQDVKQEINALIESIQRFIQKNGDVQFPGFTHTRKAMVSNISMWAGGFAQALTDNIILLNAAHELMDQSPLGSGAGFGIPLPVDRAYTAQQLNFKKVQESPVYVQLSRGKFELTFIHALSQIMLDLNRMASDIILFSMPEFGFFMLPDNYCTGSSIMPQKKNPDVLELMRARYHGIVAKEYEIRGIGANLISGYHRDLQLTKKPMMEALDQTRASLRIMKLIMTVLEVNRDQCEKALTPEVFATEKVYDLVKKGVSFREAYQRIAKEYG